MNKLQRLLIVLISFLTCGDRLQAFDPIHNSIYNTPSSSNAIYNGYNLFTENEQFPEKLNGAEDDLDVQDDENDENNDEDSVSEESLNPRHNSILEKSILNNNFESVQDIINSGQININYQNKDGKTALHFAAAQDNNRIVLLLLEHGADIALADFTGWTPLHAAVNGNAFSVVEILLNHKADPLIENVDGKTPLDLALNDYMRKILTTEYK